MFSGKFSAQRYGLLSWDRRCWLTLFASIALATVFYGVGYRRLPDRPNPSARPPRPGWWEWSDQSQYRRSVIALAQANYSPAEHPYPLGYSLVGRLFYPVMPENPFLIPDLLFYLAVCFVFVKACQMIVSPEEALLLCFFGLILPATVRDNFIRPWTNTPVHAALMVLTYLTLIGRRDRIAGIMTGVCAGVIFMTRPGDLAYSWPVMAALWFGSRGWREALQRTAWFFTGALPLVVLNLYLSFAIHGSLISAAYLRGSEQIGLGVASLGLKLYTFLIDGFPLFGERRTLITVFPILLFILPGIILFIREFRWRAVAIVATQIGAIAYFLAYNDFWISNAFKYQGIRYWIWLVPFGCLYSYLSFRVAWRELGWTATTLLLAMPVLIWIVPRMSIRPVKWELESSSSLRNLKTNETAGDVSKDSSGFNWSCKPDPADGACSMSVNLAHPVQFNIVELRGIRSIKLLYAKLWIDDQMSPMFRDHFTSDAPDGQAYIIFYGRKRGRSIRLTIPPPVADNRLSISGLELALRHTGLALQNPFTRFHLQLH